MPFDWDAPKEKAAVLVALGELTNAQIAEQCEVGESTIYNWKGSTEFKERVEENKEEIRKRVFTEGIGDLLARVRRYNKRWGQIDQVFAERAADPAHSSVPGWTTGLLCHEQKSLGSGDLATVIDVYRVDVGTIKEERELAKQAAQDLGQWSEKKDVTTDGKPLVVVDI